MENQTCQVTLNGQPFAVQSVRLNRATEAKVERPSPDLHFTVEEPLPWQIYFHPFNWGNFYVGQDVEININGIPTLLTYCGTNVAGHEGRYAFGKRV